MSAPTLTLGQLRKLDPCRDRLNAAENALPKRRRITAAQAREFGMSFDDILWAASAVARNDNDVERRLRMWMADCAARVLHVFEAMRPADDRPRRAVEASMAFARGEILATAWAVATNAAWEAAWNAEAHANAWDAAATAAWDAEAAWDTAAAWSAAVNAAYAANAWDALAVANAAGNAAGNAERVWQFDRLIAWLSDDEPEPWPLPDRLDAEAGS